MSKSKHVMTGRDFDELPDAEKERIWQEIDRTPPEELAAKSRPLNKEERALWAKAKKKLWKPKVRTVSLPIEDQLIERMDRLAKREGLTRAQIVARGLKLLLRAS
jgi:hypothetical protein